ncbi:MAG: hypothetical protein IJ542_00475 [Clostridia bacterium]|nr:hypothetical protein [Clostridia bacterium]
MDKKIKKLLKKKVPFSHFFEHSNWQVETNGSDTIFTNQKANYQIKKRNMICLDENPINGWYVVEVRDFFSKYVTLYTPEMDLSCNHKFDNIERIKNSGCFVTKARLSNDIANCYQIYNPDNNSFTLDLQHTFPTKATNIETTALLGWVRVKFSDTQLESEFVNLETGRSFGAKFESDLYDSMLKEIHFDDHELLYETIMKHRKLVSKPTYLDLFYSSPKLVSQCTDVSILESVKAEIQTLKDKQTISESMSEQIKKLASDIEVHKAKITNKTAAELGE